MSDGVYREGLREFSAGRFAAAERLFADAVKQDAKCGPAHFARGCALQRLNRHQEAVAAFDAAIAVDRNDGDAWVNRAISCGAFGQHAEAVKSFEAALAIASNRSEVWAAYGDALAARKRFEDALQAYGRALSIRPQFPEALNNRGATLFALARFDAAVKDYEALLALQPKNALATVNHGIALAHLKRFPAALASFDRGLAIEPKYAAARYHRGTALFALRRNTEALASLDAALALDGNNADAHVVRGLVLRALGRGAEALSAFARAIELAPENVEALVNRQSLLFDMKRIEDAIRDCDSALALKPDIPNLRGNRLYYRLHLCDWDGIEAEERDVVRRIEVGERVVQPFMNIALPGTAASQEECARIWVGNEYPPQEILWHGKRYGHGRMRVAYVSGDFGDHPVLKLMAGVFERHDRSAFETLAIAFGADDESALRRRAIAAFDHFIDASGKTDFEIARLMHGMEVDIAVDLMGFTGNSRHGILRHRPAPVQAQFLGFAGTMGSDRIDYLIADAVVVPQSEAEHYSEKIAYLPGSYMPHDEARAIAPVPSREAAGLPEGVFVFCAFNNAYKFSRGVFAAWMRILNAVPESILWLPAQNESARRNLLCEAASHGIAPNRLVWAPFASSSEDHLARLSLADLFLDTLPFNAHSTAMDALWAGVPVLTMPGNTFAGRVGASLSMAAGLAEMVVPSVVAYEDKAIALARNPAMLSAAKEKLAHGQSCPLFDTARFTRHLEAAFRKMRDISERGEKPSSFAIEPMA